MMNDECVVMNQKMQYVMRASNVRAEAVLAANVFFLVKIELLRSRSISSV